MASSGDGKFLCMIIGKDGGGRLLQMTLERKVKIRSRKALNAATHHLGDGKEKDQIWIFKKI